MHALQQLPRSLEHEIGYWNVILYSFRPVRLLSDGFGALGVLTPVFTFMFMFTCVFTLLYSFPHKHMHKLVNIDAGRVLVDLGMKFQDAGGRLVSVVTTYRS